MFAILLARAYHLGDTMMVLTAILYSFCVYDLLIVQVF